jgi:hypothetical protein
VVERNVNNSLVEPALIGNAIGVLVGFLLLYISTAVAFGHSENDVIAQMLFPYALALDPTLLDNPWLVLGLALAQFPLYGIIVAVAWTRPRRRAIVVIACITVLFGAHLLAVKEAHAGYAAWQETLVKGE